MAINYTWQFQQFDVAPVAGGLANVVRTIHWRLIASDDEHVVSAYGAVNLANADPDDFIAFEDITKQWAIDATSSLLDVPAQEAVLADQISALKQPPIVRLAPPFADA